ncbi:hypothetical protein AB0L04_00685 [Streptomyces glaucescens]|uniref:hypothetical protein n=1 Tax=Streptomyces glaucescens TaxID=1907 RepID=UPI00344F4151
MTHRIGINDITSDQLDALYDRLDRVREVATRWQAAAATEANALLLAGVASDMILGVLDGEGRATPAPAATEATGPAWCPADHAGHGSPCEHRSDGTCAAPAHNTGPSIREAAADDRRWWSDKYAGEGQ